MIWDIGQDTPYNSKTLPTEPRKVKKQWQKKTWMDLDGTAMVHINSYVIPIFLKKYNKVGQYGGISHKEINITEESHVK